MHVHVSFPFIQLDIQCYIDFHSTLGVGVCVCVCVCVYVCVGVCVCVCVRPID